MEFQEAVNICFKKLGEKKIMALASSVEDQVMIRNVSCIIKDRRIFFKTDRNFRKTKQLLTNPNVAICYNGVQIEGTALVHGAVVQPKNQFFQELYEAYWKYSFTSYAHKKDEILVEIYPKVIEIWDQDEQNNGFQILIDIKGKDAKVFEYD
ncbi:pyridoxamine 5'-phosphate oxidase family protein [Tetragenococcus koreensis]|uniref:pyridoxamine 5'-phosphate oxidase family protein n=1 Tax=Tetragenococcus koreensis TaxID=290335 RepID=UPI000F515548|nr:pyridoxamine 5'-phosphate oxidase family protein [Tetragenococcus koreensis]AYW45955.1 pyridoxamine 5-phosphate oxidase [Tetragenococcus koreensis]MCF1621348.1 pyridoxamine 5'-phosphate oxidase family protein [Tetragenococcus koreensis]MCF1626402.1 pyridoxamine 5'-phosphate oxidase family protein [Tetragenococcus koreensis]MCF1677398.1 pyridoxamine 5'-phosphate oxidase family protein [Tetragenococcus koreensis]MCF1679731.1 pyridoxamine 5'-phosphate oxidase family protein [Tetragenococcus ko